MHARQQPARPHGAAVKPSPLSARTRRSEVAAFPRSDLWSWKDDGAKDELVESMLRECVPPVAVPSTPALNFNAPMIFGGNNRPQLVSQRQPLTTASQHSHLQSPPGSQTSRRRNNVQSPPTTQPPPQLQPSSSKNLTAVASAQSTGQDAWKAFKVAHRTNKILSKTRKMISVLTRQSSSTKNIHGGDNQYVGSADSDVGEDNEDADADVNGEMSEEALAAAKLEEVKAKFQREVLDEEATDSNEGNGNAFSTSIGNIQSGSEDFWKMYKASATSQRPDSARGRYIASYQDTSLIVLPVLDLKRPSRYERVNQTLRYDNYYFGDKRAEALGNALQLLPLPVQSLSMKNVGVSGSGSSAIMNGIPMKQLKHLNFSDNRLGAKGTQTIYRTLENPQIHLKSLDIGNNQLGDQAVRTLMQCLLNRCTLEHLDLRRNNIFHAAILIGELLRITTPLTSLNLSWNNIRGKPAQHLARCMMENLTLTHLDLSDNTLGNNGKADAELGACLATNKSLRVLDISNNHVQAKSVLVYVNGLQQNTVLKTLVFRGNPVGVVGGEAIVRAVASGSVLNCQIDIGDCNLDILDGNLEGTTYGGGTFILNLNERSDGILLKELLQLVWKNKMDIVEVIHNGIPFTFNKKDEKTFVTCIPSQGSMQVKFQPNYDRHEDLISAAGFDGVVRLMDRSFGRSRDGDEAAKLFCIRVLAEEYSFTVAEANTLLSLFESHTSLVEKANAAAAIIPQIHLTPSAQIATEEIYDCASMETPKEFFVDKDGDGKIDVCGDICMTIGLENLSDIEQSHVEQKVGKWVSFNVNNPSGRYQLNMANSIDRRILMRILEVNKMERKMRQQLKLMDTSQHGLVAQPLQCGFRNMKLNHLPILMGANWQFPRLGILEFDFVMTRRPYAVCTALSDGAFEQFLKEFKQLQVTAEMKLIGLRSISTLYYFTCSQTQRIMEHFGTFERDPTTGCLLRGEVFIVLFSRIVDEWNLSETLSLLDLTTKTQVLDRLGVLNCFHPLQQIETYRNLQFSSHEHRQMILILVKLTISGEAELTNTQLNGNTIESDVWRTWTNDDKLPALGVLSCSMRALHGIQSETQLPPTSVRKKLLQSLVFKLEDKASEVTLM
ncbi:Leucine-rich repeat-containing protein 74B [Phytophthora citrophthora]|uniref:Leucine-rich repeat-containing protein 74B n=1 Tax=Phytophthora citrophthora TaxID=4793 RepID=A0AAD9GB99_9STRA|nr:Leucine-rich repeat-containing protein 74B [Phytophthora citrophthora]